MGLGDVVDELLNQHSLSDTSTSEETDLSSTSVGGKEVDNLDTGLQDFSSGGLVDEWWGLSVDRRELDTLDRATFVDGFTNDVHDATEGSSADGNHDGGAGVNDLGATDKTLCTVHSNGTDRVLTKMGGDLKNETTTAEILDLEGVQDRREVVSVELDVDDGTNDGLH